MVNTPGNCRPFSLKGKTVLDLVTELKRSRIGVVLDVRRKDSNSAPRFYPSNLKRELETVGIVYVAAFTLSNDRFRNASELFLRDVSRALVTYRLYVEQKNERTALLCYCPKKEQEAGRCHAAWLADHFNQSTIRRPLKRVVR